MIKLLWRLALLTGIGFAFAWLANRPGKLSINWLNHEVEMSILVATFALVVLAAGTYLLSQALSKLWRSPKSAREYWRFRKHRKAYEALSQGIIAANAGDPHAASRHAVIAANTLTDEPLVNVLAAQAAQLKGDRVAMKRLFEHMTKSPDTEVLGLRGLFSEAKQSGDLAHAIQFAEKAFALNPRLVWASAAMLQIQLARRDWEASSKTISVQGKSGILAKADLDIKRAALLTAEAFSLEEVDRSKALAIAAQAHQLDISLVPAALVAARCHIALGNTRKAVRILRDTWQMAPHPDLADVLAHSRPNDSPEDKFERVRDLVGNTDESLEGAVALARAAISAKRWDVARSTLQPHIAATPQARVCAMMAQIDEAQDEKLRAREWLAKALNAPRDPMWVSDGVASPRWTPVSPVTGEIVPCQWKSPFETIALPEFNLDVGLTAQGSLELVSGGDKQTLNAAPRPPDDPGVQTEDPLG